MLQGGGWAQISLPALPLSGSSGSMGYGGQKSKERKPAESASSRTPPGFVLKVLFGDTSFHITIFICERDRIFLNGCNFWLFPLKKKSSFLVISSCLCFSVSGTLVLYKHTHAHTHTPADPQTHTYTQAGRPLVQQLLFQDSG